MEEQLVLKSECSVNPQKLRTEREDAHVFICAWRYSGRVSEPRLTTSMIKSWWSDSGVRETIVGPPFAEFQSFASSRTSFGLASSAWASSWSIPRRSLVVWAYMYAHWDGKKERVLEQFMCSMRQNSGGLQGHHVQDSSISSASIKIFIRTAARNVQPAPLVSRYEYQA